MHLVCEFLQEPDQPPTSRELQAQLERLHPKMEIGDDRVSRLQRKASRAIQKCRSHALPRRADGVDTPRSRTNQKRRKWRHLSPSPTPYRLFRSRRPTTGENGGIGMASLTGQIAVPLFCPITVPKEGGSGAAESNQVPQSE